MTTLTPRLKKITEYVSKRGIVADIGTDHALVPVYLIENNLCEYAYACDIAQEPLKKASEFILSKKLEDKIKVILSDGLEKVPDDADTVIIAGMGGELIADIIKKGIKHRKCDFILQPMTMQHVLRRFLYENEFEITDETVVTEREKTYCIMKAVYTGKIKQYTLLETYVSDRLLTYKTSETIEYIKRLYNEQIKIINGLEASKTRNEEKILLTKRIAEDLSRLIEK